MARPGFAGSKCVGNLDRSGRAGESPGLPLGERGRLDMAKKPTDAAIASLTATSRTNRATSTGRRPMPRCLRSSTTSSARSEPTYTAAGCTRRWSTGRQRAAMPISRPGTETSRRSGGGPRRSCTPARSRRSRARERGSSASSTQKRSGKPNTARNTTSRLAAPSSPARRSPQAWSMSATCSSGRSWSVAASERYQPTFARSSSCSTIAAADAASYTSTTAIGR